MLMSGLPVMIKIANKITEFFFLVKIQLQKIRGENKPSCHPILLGIED